MKEPRAQRQEAADAPPSVVAGMTPHPIGGADLLSRLGTSGDGAVVAFEGRVRRQNAGRDVVRLRYESYRDMADDVLQEIGREALALYPVTQVGVLHREGALEVGEVSLVVGVSAAHREPALEATRYVIEQLKSRLPVWKREEYADGSTEWVEGAGRGGA